MHHSISSISFGKKSGYTEVTESASTSSRRSRARSSLDTFIIPGRTRLPSSKPDLTDIQITQSLLTHGVMQPQDKQRSIRPEPHRSSRTKSSSIRDGSPAARPRSRTKRLLRPPVPMRVRPAIAMQPPPRSGSREVIVVPHQRPRKDGFQQIHAITTIQDQGQDQAYDGADEPEQPGNIHTPSRMTSKNWGTLNHRVLTDSTCSSRRSGASYFKDEYNQLAEKHGIRRMAAAPSGALNSHFTNFGIL